MHILTGTAYSLYKIISLAKIKFCFLFPFGKPDKSSDIYLISKYYINFISKYLYLKYYLISQGRSKSLWKLMKKQHEAIILYMISCHLVKKPCLDIIYQSVISFIWLNNYKFQDFKNNETELLGQYFRVIKADFLSSQVLASSQNNFLSSHLDEHRPSWSFKQRQQNQAITITLRLTEHANISLNTYPVVVFSHLSLQSLFPCTSSQQCFTTATTRSFHHFEHLELSLSLYCDVAFTRSE